MIGIHAERVAGDEACVRFVIPPGMVPVGRVCGAPGRLGELLADGTLSDALTESGAVWLWTPDGGSWARMGSAVQSALRDALGRPQEWTVNPAPGEVLEHVVTDLLDGSVGEFIRSHGGSALVERHGDEVSVALGGACEHCAAAEHTLRLRLMGELRRRCPDLLEVDRGRGALTVRLGG